MNKQEAKKRLEEIKQEMHAFAHVRNEGWEADWENENQSKWGIRHEQCIGFYVDLMLSSNAFAFGIAVKSKEIAQEMFEEFGERITQIYNKQY